MTKIKVEINGIERMYEMKSPALIQQVSPVKSVLFMFHDGEIYTGYTRGEVINGNIYFFAKSETGSRYESISKPFKDLAGWAYVN